ncbi:Major Facilitator Superfamily protein [Pseudomonas flavescens]|uniref:Major Facilitator Superfamily protein n=1 Tax=Phytopseudomonas flavescens TaxID=29435 RepID=A0A1G8EFQ7_9GAMM|nr:MFS transporter [Pseudomonas flavescens]SDH68600.1 Major Facilitator Superfamily protein [Pseudomonas flavescens]
MNALRQPPAWRLQLVFGWLHFVLAVPSIYLLLGLPLVMREHGWSGTDIGLFQLAGLPAVFKFLLALPVQRYRSARGHYRAWAWMLCLSLALLLILVSQQAITAPRLHLFGLALLAGVLATWADIPVNALAIKLLPPSQQIRAGGIRSAALFIGAIVGAGVMLLVQSRWGWQAPFLLMAGGLLLALLPLGLLGESASEVAEPQHARPSLSDWSGYFSQPGAWLWTWVLLGGFPFVGAAWLYLKPLLLDQGMPVQQVAWVAGIGGGVVGALASLLGGRLVRRRGPGPALPWCMAFALVALLALTAAVWLKASLAWLVFAAFLLACAMGGISTLVFGLMMCFSRRHHQAADYGLQASLFVLTRLLVPVAAGVLLDHRGPVGMLLGLSLAMFAVCGLALAARRSVALATAAVHDDSDKAVGVPPGCAGENRAAPSVGQA